MKKMWILLILILFGFNNHLNTSFVEGKEYNMIYTKNFKTPNIVEFFSFLCPYCYNLEKKYRINHYIKKKFLMILKLLSIM